MKTKLVHLDEGEEIVSSDELRRLRELDVKESEIKPGVAVTTEEQARVIKNWGFDLPEGAVITGIKVDYSKSPVGEETENTTETQT